MMDAPELHLDYDGGFIQTEPVELPGSKSMAARALIISALAGNDISDIKDLPDCDDTRHMAEALRTLEAAAGPLPQRFKEENPPPVHISVNLGLGGTTLRFFTALAASLPGVVTDIDCAPGLRGRPLSPLIDALEQAGAEITFLEEKGKAPFTVKGSRPQGGRIRIDSSVSSQFISALMMVAPYWRDGLHIDFNGIPPVSFPYISMTAEIMRLFQASVAATVKCIDVHPGDYRKVNRCDVEPDWSCVSYFYELSALMPGREIHISRLTPPEMSVQGDSGCAGLFALLGVRTTYNPDGSATLLCNREVLDDLRESAKPLALDMESMPDLVPALAVTLSLCGIKFEFSGIAHLRVKESNRLAALVNELGKLGYILEEGSDSLCWSGAVSSPENVINGCSHKYAHECAVIDTYGDHRIAMAFGPAAAALPSGITLRDPSVTDKSFPSYFTQVGRLGLIGSTPSISHK